MRQRARELTVVLATFAAVLVILSAGLRPDSFYVGDPGVKLISTRNVLRFPAHPLNIPLPRIGAEATPHVESFFAVHGDHSHAVTSELFPVVSAPMLALFGMRGLYVLPAAGFIATLAACAWFAVVLDVKRHAAIVAAVAGLGTPFLFYGLEFWEHTLALALGVGGAALLLDAARRRPGQHADGGAPLAAGLLMGASIVLRLEAACFVVAVAVASRSLEHRPSWRALTIAGAGVALAILPLEIYTVVHFGSLVPGHVGVNAGIAQGLGGDGRLHIAADWLLPSLWNADGPARISSFWSVAPAAVLALLAPVTRPAGRERFFLVAVAMVTTLLVIVTAPNDGGGQWGPRYLLFAYVPLIALAGDVVQRLPRRGVSVVAIVLLFTAAVWVQRAAYRQLRGTKATYGRIVDFVSRNTSAGTHLVTDVWWLDQLAASAVDGRTLLFAGEPETGSAIVRRLDQARVPAVTVFRSGDQSADTDGWSAGTCYVEDERQELSTRKLVAIKLRRRCR